MNRREALQLLAAAALGPGLGASASLSPGAGAGGPPPPIAAPPTIHLTTDDAFLDDLSRRAVLYFLEQSSPTTGQTLDRAPNFAPPTNPDTLTGPRRMASIAATGFGLTALCIADHHAYHPRPQLIEQVRRTLRFHANELPHNHGFFFHFNDVVTGHRYRDSELSSIDTALLLCGVLTARAHFHDDPEIVSLATTLYNRVDWPWMLNNGPTFSMGWKPDLKDGQPGFLPGRWNHYSELMMLYLLALGSPTHPIPSATWDAFGRPHMRFAGFDYISAADPLFVHQYSHAWFDFRHKSDIYADYFANSILATRAHKAFCVNLGQPYSNNYWGISASDSQHGYTAWGGPGAHTPNPTPAELAHGFGEIDGSVIPNAAAGSLPFLPADCLHVLRALKSTYGDKAYGRYGFCDAFHPSTNWFDPDVLGIDQGITLLMAENLRSCFVWQTFARNPEPSIAMKRAGFHAIQG